MRRLLAVLSLPIDPVVAVHASSEEADATLRALGRAGYGRSMLTVVGQSDAGRDGERFPQELASAPRSWVASGMAWGALWAGCTALATLVVPTSAWGFVILALLGAAALALHVAVAWRVVAPEAVHPADHSAKRPAAGGRPSHACPCQFLVLVRGTRSDIALARTILAH